jgi:hypothetical protein
MARPKSIPGRKTSPTAKSNEQAITQNPVESTEAKTITTDVPAQQLRQEPPHVPEGALVPESNGTKEAKAEPRKLEMVKNESRKNLVPINLEDEIRQRAFELYQERGPRDGGEAEDWRDAEREIMQRYRQQSA